MAYEVVFLAGQISSASLKKQKSFSVLLQRTLLAVPPYANIALIFYIVLIHLAKMLMKTQLGTVWQFGVTVQPYFGRTFWNCESLFTLPELRFICFLENV